MIKEVITFPRLLRQAGVTIALASMPLANYLDPSVCPPAYLRRWSKINNQRAALKGCPLASQKIYQEKKLNR
jgi:hypothetical protein